MHSFVEYNFSPIKPDLMNWNSLYPFYFPFNKESKEDNDAKKCVEFVDIGCGYGGLLGIKIFFILYCIIFHYLLLIKYLFNSYIITNVS